MSLQKLSASEIRIRALRDVTFPMHADGAEGGALKD